MKVNDPLSVKRWPVALSPVNILLAQVRVTRTGLTVEVPVEGVKLAVGLVVSIQSTVAVVDQVCPTRSE